MISDQEMGEEQQISILPLNPSYMHTATQFGSHMTKP